MTGARREKRTKPRTVHMPPALDLAVQRLAQGDRRSLSTYIVRVLEADPTVRIVLQQIDAAGGSH